VTELAIDVQADGDSARMILSGEFDLAGIETFRRAVAELDSMKTIVVDLNQVEFMDSSGLRALVIAHDRAKAAQRRLAIIPGPPHVRRVFEITQLDGRVDLIEG
jgi:anti-anti-sigma factor